jgi:uncharacterized protein with ATP-grasp and redox domains
MASKDEALHLEIAREAMAEVAKVNLDEAPPVMAKRIKRIVERRTGQKDLYLKEKDISTKLALELLPDLRRRIAEAPADKKFEIAARLSIAGNIIDYGTDRHFKPETIKAKIEEALSEPLDTAAVETLRLSLDSAKNILFLADNCGEAVLDRLLIEPYRHKTTLAVRGGPILNDVTRREIEMSGLEGFAKIIDTGDSTPGIDLSESSEEFLDAFRRADLIIAKGQGNFETLSETDRPVIFLFRAKCKVVEAFLGHVKHGSMQIRAKNITAA